MKNKFQSQFKEDANQSLGLLFIKAYNAWHKAIKNALIEVDITHPQFVVMASLGYLSQLHTEVTQVMISEQSNIDTRTLSQILKLLVQKGLIKRGTSDLDSRANKTSLTSLGEEKLNQALIIVEEIDDNYFKVLDKKEQGELSNYLMKLENFKNLS